jgi:hypothetical protein
MTQKSKRIYILNNEEIDALYSLPKFNQDEKEIFIELTKAETHKFNNIDDAPTKIHFILQLGYISEVFIIINFTKSDK